MAIANNKRMVGRSKFTRSSENIKPLCNQKTAFD